MTRRGTWACARAVSLGIFSLLLGAGCRHALAGVDLTPKDQWGSIVLFEREGQCFVIAGPPRINAKRGHRITWRVYNACRPGKERAEATVTITELKRTGAPRPQPTPKGYFPDKPGTTYHEGQYPEPSPGTPPENPLDPGNPTIMVAPGNWVDLTVRVKPDARYGLYTYVVVVNGSPDKDQDIWIDR